MESPLAARAPRGILGPKTQRRRKHVPSHLPSMHSPYHPPNLKYKSQHSLTASRSLCKPVNMPWTQEKADVFGHLGRDIARVALHFAFGSLLCIDSVESACFSTALWCEWH